MGVSYSMQLRKLSDLVVTLKSAAADIQAQLDALDSSVRELRSRWSGDAADAYDLAHARWTRTMSELNVVLEQGALAAQNAVDRHTAARERVTQLWTQ